MIITDKRITLETEFHKLTSGQAFTRGIATDEIYVKLKEGCKCTFNAIKFDVDVAEPILVAIDDYEEVLPISMEIILKHYDYYEKEM